MAVHPAAIHLLREVGDGLRMRRTDGQQVMAQQKKSAAQEDNATSRYRKIEARTWGDERFCALSPIPPCGQGLFLFLILGPHAGPIPGLFHVGRAALAEVLNWELEAFDKAFQEVFQQGMVEADWKARVVWFPNGIKHNKPASPNVVKNWGTNFDLIPECDLKRKAYEALKEAISSLGESYADAFAKTFRKPSAKASATPSANASPMPSRNQEQEQEQDLSSVANATGQSPSSPDPIFGDGLAYLMSTGDTERGARAFLGKMRQALSNDLVAAELLAEAQKRRVSDPKAWLRKAAQNRVGAGTQGNGVAL